MRLKTFQIKNEWAYALWNDDELIDCVAGFTSEADARVAGEGVMKYYQQR
jgi:hypothetical protein